MTDPRTSAPHHPVLGFFVWVTFVVALPGCGLGLYDLPAPPAESEWRDVSLIPGEEDRNSQANYLRARATALRLYDALSNERWEESWSLLSRETQSSLERGAAGQGGLAVLRDGLYSVPAGGAAGASGDEIYSFDPVDHLIVQNIVTFKDEVSGESEEETARRKEIYAVSESGEVKKLVVIFEGDAWRIHKTNFDGTDLTLADTD